jgi:hypothetical protein
MGTSEAIPANLITYSVSMTNADVVISLRSELILLPDYIEQYRMTAIDYGSGIFPMYGTDRESTVEQIRDVLADIVRLDGWVKDVGVAFEIANGLTTLTGGPSEDPRIRDRLRAGDDAISAYLANESADAGADLAARWRQSYADGVELAEEVNRDGTGGVLDRLDAHQDDSVFMAAFFTNLSRAQLDQLLTLQTTYVAEADQNRDAAVLAQSLASAYASGIMQPEFTHRLLGMLTNPPDQAELDTSRGNLWQQRVESLFLHDLAGKPDGADSFVTQLSDDEARYLATAGAPAVSRAFGETVGATGPDAFRTLIGQLRSDIGRLQAPVAAVVVARFIGDYYPTPHESSDHGLTVAELNTLLRRGTDDAESANEVFQAAVACGAAHYPVNWQKQTEFDDWSDKFSSFTGQMWKVRLDNVRSEAEYRAAVVGFVTSIAAGLVAAGVLAVTPEAVVGGASAAVGAAAVGPLLDSGAAATIGEALVENTLGTVLSQLASPLFQDNTVSEADRETAAKRVIIDTAMLVAFDQEHRLVDPGPDHVPVSLADAVRDRKVDFVMVKPGEYVLLDTLLKSHNDPFDRTTG